MTSSPDDREQIASAAIDDDSLIETDHPMSSYPAFPAKQIVLSVAAGVLVLTMFLPWWDAEIPLDRVADTLNGWLLFATGLSIGSLGANTGYTWFGNLLFGIIPTVPVLVLIVLLVLRVLRIYVAPASTLFIFSLLGSLGALWLLLYGTLRINAANGVYPAMVGPWIVLVVTLALATLCILWWRTERIHFPKRASSRRRSSKAVGDEPLTTDTDELFAGIDDNDEFENEQLTLGPALGNDLGGGLDGTDREPSSGESGGDRRDGDAGAGNVR